MKFKIDENLPAELAEEIELYGYDAESVIDEGLTGAPDPVVLSVAARENRVLLTLDKGIASLLRFPPSQHAGVVLFRPGTAGRRAVLTFVKSRLDVLLARQLANCVTVVSDTRIRVR